MQKRNRISAPRASGDSAQLVLSLAPELAKLDVYINAIAPGGIVTDMAAAVAHKYLHPASTLDGPTAFRTMVACGRLARPEEIAAAVAFLVLDDASYITGPTIAVDGGLF